MTDDSDFKQLVRDRAAKTGESYQAARRQLERQRGRFSARATMVFGMPEGVVLGCVIEGGEVTQGMTVTVVTGEAVRREAVVVGLRHQKTDLESLGYGGPFGEFGLLLDPAYDGPLPAHVTG